MTLACDRCGALYHSACTWGQFYLMQGTSWREQARRGRRWVCGNCLVNANVEIFDTDLRQWACGCAVT